ncbi:MAG: Dps family protein [Planctomycetota bacterium]
MDIGIPEEQRKEIAADLSLLLADSYTLYLKSHYYHWNVVGPMFQTLHLMFEQHYNALALAVDEIAERIRSLGEPAPGTYREFSGMSSIEEDEDVPAAEDMIRNLVLAHEQVVRTARKAMAAAEDANDATTEDLLTQRMEFSEKTAWMLRSLLA